MSTKFWFTNLEGHDIDHQQSGCHTSRMLEPLCHPLQRVTGVANRLRRRPCFRGRIDAVDFYQSVNIVSEWELTPS